MRDIWRTLYMICCRIFFVFIFFINIATAQEDKTKSLVIPINGDKQDLNIGEIYPVKIQSSKGTQELKSYKNKFINSSMYVLEYIEPNSYIVFINTPKKAKNENTFFEPSGFNIREMQGQPPQSFAILDTPFKDEEKTNNLYQYIVIAIIVFFLLIIMYISIPYMIKKIKKRKYVALRKKELQAILENVQERKQFEKIYQYKKDFKKYTKIDIESLDNYIDELNTIQYKKDWSDEDFLKMKKTIVKLQQSGIV